MDNKYIVSVSPHITSRDTTQRIMLDVIIALVPVIIASVLIFGFYTLFLTLLCVESAMFAEFIYNRIRKKEQTVKDLSAVVTGIILGLNLPATVPVWVPIVGAFFAILVVKMLFGGIGRNFANPAIAARIFLILAWGSLMSQKSAVIDLGASGSLFDYFGYAFSIAPDAVTSATPLGLVKNSIESGANPAAGLSALDMFLGRIPASAAGETCTLAILLGGAYLIVRRVIDWKIPLCYIGSAVLFTALLYCNSEYVGQYVWTYLLGGGLMFGAIFMATDYTTSPKSVVGTIIYGVSLGFLTVIFRKYSTMNEGVSYAILLMNLCVPFLDKIKAKPFGTPKKNYAKIIKDKKAAKAAKKTAEAAKGGQNG